MPFTEVTITANFRTGDNAAAEGTVTFTPTVPMRNGNIRVAAPVIGSLDSAGLLRAVNGASALALAATTDPGTQPANTTYTVDENIVNQPRRTYKITVPHTTSSLDLASIAPAVTTPMFGYELAGAASGLVADHVAQPDPHPVYLNAARAAAAYQPLDSDLTTLAGLTATTNHVVQSVAGSWASRTPAQLKSTLGLVRGDVGLGNVDNTSDAAKPVSTAQQAALNGRQPLDDDLTTIAGLNPTTDNILQSAGGAWASRTPTQVKATLNLVKGDVGLGSVDNVQQQPADPRLSALAGLAAGTDQLPYWTGTTSAGQTPLTAFARTVLDDVSAVAARTTLGVAYGTSAGTVTQGNDPRLSDARTPVAHTHDAAAITAGQLAVERMPQVVSAVRAITSATGTIALDAGQVGNFRDFTATGDITFQVPTGGSHRQVLYVDVLASNGQRTVTFDNAYRLFPGIDSRTFTIPTGQLGQFAVKFSTLVNGWTLFAGGVS